MVLSWSSSKDSAWMLHVLQCGGEWPEARMVCVGVHAGRRWHQGNFCYRGLALT